MVQPTGHRMGVGDIVSQFYMLNHIIRLQAVVEFITNETTLALELISSQQRQTRAAVHLNGLVLDYLLAEEEGVCEKFNTSDCCLLIDDNGDAVLDIAKTSGKWPMYQSKSGSL